MADPARTGRESPHRYAEARSGWEAVGAVWPDALHDARLQLHWAAQLVGAVGAALVPPRPDFSHTAMSWSDEDRMLVGEAWDGEWRIALRPSDLTLALLDEGAVIRVPMALTGHTLDDALRWIRETIPKLTGVPLAREIALPTYEMPSHGVARGQPFAPAGFGAYREYGRWFANATRFLEAVRGEEPNASPVRCWPHHFDIATLIPLDADEQHDPDAARSIGCGLSPGDGSHDEPYFYVNPWPPPAAGGFPPIEGGGEWHTEGWLGAVLPTGPLREVGGDDAAAARVEAFLRSGLRGARELLEKTA